MKLTQLQAKGICKTLRHCKLRRLLRGQFRQGYVELRAEPIQNWPYVPPFRRCEHDLHRLGLGLFLRLPEMTLPPIRRHFGGAFRSASFGAECRDS